MRIAKQLTLPVLLFTLLLLVSCDTIQPTDGIPLSSDDESVQTKEQQTDDTNELPEETENKSDVDDLLASLIPSSEGLEFELNSDGKGYTVVGIGTCNDANIVISSYKGLPVTGIKAYAFRGCGEITSVTIGNGVTRIGEEAFAECDVKEVTMGDSVESMGWYVFMECEQLVTVKLSENLQDIGRGAFKSCTSLMNVILPTNITCIRAFAFYGCSSLKQIHIPESVTFIEEEAFYECAELNTITGGEHLESIEQEAFRYSAYYENEANWINDVLYIGDYLLEAKSTLSGHYTIAQGTKVIGDRAFSGCHDLTSIEIPDGIKRIGISTFNSCYKLTEIVLPDSVTSIDKNAFFGCAGLTRVVLSNNLTSIGEYAFAECTRLADIQFPDSLGGMGDYAFVSCYSLTTIEIPEGVVHIRRGTFSHCTALVSVVIPKSVTYIQKETFDSCSALSSIFYEGSDNEWASVDIEGSTNSASTIVYCYSETAPAETGNFWHYVDGVPTPW